MESPYLTVDEAADYLRVSRRTVYRLIETGKLPVVRLRSCVRIHRDALDRCAGAQGGVDGPSVAARPTRPTRRVERPEDV